MNVKQGGIIAPRKVSAELLPATCGNLIENRI